MPRLCGPFFSDQGVVETFAIESMLGIDREWSVSISISTEGLTACRTVEHSRATNQCLSCARLQKGSSDAVTLDGRLADGFSASFAGETIHSSVSIQGLKVKEWKRLFWVFTLLVSHDVVLWGLGGLRERAVSRIAQTVVGWNCPGDAQLHPVSSKGGQHSASGRQSGPAAHAGTLRGMEVTLSSGILRPLFPEVEGGRNASWQAQSQSLVGIISGIQRVWELREVTTGR